MDVMIAAWGRRGRIACHFLRRSSKKAGIRVGNYFPDRNHLPKWKVVSIVECVRGDLTPHTFETNTAKGAIIMTRNISDRDQTTGEVDPAKARELLGIVRQSQMSAAPSLSPMWIPYSIFCVGGSTYPLLSFAFAKAGMGELIPILVLFGWVIVAAILMAITMRSAIKRQARGFGGRWTAMMAAWGITFMVAIFASRAAVDGQLSVWTLVGIAALFAILAINGPVIELVTVRKAEGLAREKEASDA